MTDKAGAESEPGTTNAKHNILNITKVVKNCAAAMLVIQTERAELNARASDIREVLKTAGVDPKAFAFALKIEQQAVEDREKYLESLVLSFDALGIGGQSEMFGS